MFNEFGELSLWLFAAIAGVFGAAAVEANGVMFALAWGVSTVLVAVALVALKTFWFA